MTCCPTCGAPVADTKLRIDFQTGLVSYAGHTARVSPQQAEILHLLEKAYPQFATRDHLVARVNGQRTDQGFCSRTLTVQIFKMRKALAGMPLQIEAMWGTGGYRLVLAS